MVLCFSSRKDPERSAPPLESGDRIAIRIHQFHQEAIDQGDEVVVVGEKIDGLRIGWHFKMGLSFKLGYLTNHRNIGA